MRMLRWIRCSNAADLLGRRVGDGYIACVLYVWLPYPQKICKSSPHNNLMQ